MVKIPPQEKHRFPQVLLSTDEKRRLPVVKIRYVQTPDADRRFSRAIDILLGSAAGEPKGSINAQIEEESLEDSRPEKVAKGNEEI